MKYYVAIDLGGTRIKIGVFDQEKMILSHNIPSNHSKGFGLVLNHIKNEIFSILPKGDVDTIVFGYPGLVNFHKKKVISIFNKYNDINQYDLQKWAKKTWNADCLIDNDARLFCLGEWKYGNGKGFDDLVVITLGTGVGTSTVIRGKILLGKHFQAGCLGGHFTIDLHSEMCACGNIGCTEYLASSWSLPNIIERHLGHTWHTWAIQHNITSKKEIDFKKIYSLVQENDIYAKEIWNYCIRIWSVGIVNLIHAYDPEKIIIGGGITNSGEELIHSISNYVHRNAYLPEHTIQFSCSSNSDSQALYGCFYLAKHKNKVNDFYL